MQQGFFLKCSKYSGVGGGDGRQRIFSKMKLPMRVAEGGLSTHQKGVCVGEVGGLGGPSEELPPPEPRPEPRRNTDILGVRCFE